MENSEVDMNYTEDMSQEEFENGHVILPGINDLPEFANPEARLLNEENLELEKNNEKVAEDIYEMKDRVKVMKAHLTNVKQELEHTNSLQSAKNNEIHTETHLRQLTSRALGRSQLESKKMTQDIEDAQEQLNSLQTMIFKATQQLDEFKMKMNWNQEELEQWAVAAKQKEEDFQTIEKYKLADDFNIKELNLQQVVLMKELLAAKDNLENEASEGKSKQMELDRIALEFKNAHKDRQDCVQRWTDTMSEIKKRDTEINQIGEKFAGAKEKRAIKEHQLDEQTKKLQKQLTENKEIKEKADSLSRILLRKREEMIIKNRQLEDFRGELDATKNELVSCAEKLIGKRNEHSNNLDMLEEKKIQLERERQRYSATKESVADANDTAKMAEMTAKEAEDELNKREANLEQHLAALKLLKEKVIKASQSIFELEKSNTREKENIAGMKSLAKNLESQLNQLDREAARQQELLYNAEFQIQQIERKIARGMGERSDEEKLALKHSIEEHEARLNLVRDKRKMLQGQSRKLQNELVMYKQRKESFVEKFSTLTEAVAEKDIENKMIEEEMKKERKQMEEVAVLNDLARLEVRRLRDLLSAKSDAVFSLENRKQQLLLSMEERKEEINVHRDLLKAELKVLDEDKHKVTMELRERQANVVRLKARFEAVARGEDEGHSQAYYIIKAAQKREELQRKGDQLDQAVRKCEREIRALQTTLDHLNARNKAYRESFQKVDMKGSDAEILKQMEDRTKMNKESLFRKKKELQRLATDLEEDTRRFEQLDQQNNKAVQQKEHLESARNQIQEEIEVQEKQSDELVTKMTKALEKHRKRQIERSEQKVTMDTVSIEEKAVKAEVLKDVIQNVLYTLGQLSSEFPEVSETLNTKLKEAELRIPTQPPSKTTTFGVTKA